MRANPHSSLDNRHPDEEDRNQGGAEPGRRRPTDEAAAVPHLDIRPDTAATPEPAGKGSGSTETPSPISVG